MKYSLSNLRYSFRCLGIVIKRYPLYLIGKFVELICSVVNSLIPINIVGKIVIAFQSEKSFTDIVFLVISNLLVLIILNIIKNVIDFLMYFIYSNFRQSFSITLFEKLKGIDYKFHENKDFLDNYTRALDGGAENIYNVAQNQMRIITLFVECIFIFGIILSVTYYAVLYAVIIALIYLYIRKISGQLQFKLNTEQRPYNRLEWGISRMYFVKDAIPDIKTTGINEVMLDEHEFVCDKRLEIYRKIIKKKALCDAIGNCLISSIFPVILLFVCITTIRNKDVASLASLTVAATTISTSIVSLTGALTAIQIHSLEAKVTFEVLDMSANIENDNGIDADGFECLNVNNISFAYDDVNILDGITLSINKGEKVAILGTNGAGKTTFVKLLLRLYDVNDGSILFNKENYKDINVKKLRKRIGAVFQNPEVYSVTVGENVLLKKIETEEERELVINALKFADIYDYVLTLPQGIDTVVTREFQREGAIFSGGQMQKIAVARGYAQNYDVLLLDEPSSRLDPFAETKMYHNMLKMGEGKTLLFISHRLSATIDCDKIFLFERGKIVEEGTHDELMCIENGKYREMFISQSEKYIGEDNEDC